MSEPPERRSEEAIRDYFSELEAYQNSLTESLQTSLATLVAFYKELEEHDRALHGQRSTLDLQKQELETEKKKLPNPEYLAHLEKTVEETRVRLTTLQENQKREAACNLQLTTERDTLREERDGLKLRLREVLFQIFDQETAVTVTLPTRQERLQTELLVVEASQCQSLPPREALSETKRQISPKPAAVLTDPEELHRAFYRQPELIRTPPDMSQPISDTGRRVTSAVELVSPATDSPRSPDPVLDAVIAQLENIRPHSAGPLMSGSTDTD